MMDSSEEFYTDDSLFQAWLELDRKIGMRLFAPQSRGNIENIKEYMPILNKAYEDYNEVNIKMSKLLERLNTRLFCEAANKTV